MPDDFVSCSIFVPLLVQLTKLAHGFWSRVIPEKKHHSRRPLALMPDYFAVALDPVIQAMSRHAQTSSDLRNRQASLSNLPDSFDFEFFGITWGLLMKPPNGLHYEA